MSANALKLILMLALVCATRFADAGDYEDGVEAYRARDFGKALNKFRLAATAGEAYAQTILGSMYASGE